MRKIAFGFAALAALGLAMPLAAPAKAEEGRFVVRDHDRDRDREHRHHFWDGDREYRHHIWDRDRHHDHDRVVIIKRHRDRDRD